MLAERENLEVSPFVGQWHPSVASMESISRVPPFFDTRFMKAVTEGPAHNFVGDNRSPAIVLGEFVDNWLGSRNPMAVYQSLASRLIELLRDLMKASPEAVDYLTPLVRAGMKTPGLTVATLNYDRTIEMAAEEADVAIDTGVKGWAELGEWRWDLSGIRLLKLHGSIDWGWSDTYGGNGRLRHRQIELDPEPSEPALVFGQRGKLKAEGPFLSLLGEFEKQLFSCNRLICVGYSFRDEHVNQILGKWTDADRDQLLVAVDPKWPDGETGSDFREFVNNALRIPEDWPHHGTTLDVLRVPCSEALTELF